MPQATSQSLDLTQGQNGATGTAKQIAAQAREKAQGAKQAASSKITEEVDRRSTQAGNQVSALAFALRQTGENLSEQPEASAAVNLTRAAADRLDAVGGYLRDNDGESIMGDIEAFARRQPWLVAAASAALGVAAARFLKASNDRQQSGA